MDTSNYAKGIVTVIITVVIAAAMFIPLVASAQDSAGDAITKDNYTWNAYYKDFKNGDVLKADSTGISLNDEPIADALDRPLFYADNVYVTIFNTGLTYTIFNDNDAIAQDSGTVATFTFTTNSVTVNATVSGVEKTRTISIGWAKILCPEGAGDYCLHSAQDAYVRNVNEIYGAGYNSTATSFYSFNGETSSANLETTYSTNTVSGTTDILSATPTCSIGSTSFSPDFVVVPLEVHGHADSGAVYSLLGILPLIVLVGLVMGAIGMFIRARL